MFYQNIAHKHSGILTILHAGDPFSKSTWILYFIILWFFLTFLYHSPGMPQSFCFHIIFVCFMVNVGLHVEKIAFIDCYILSLSLSFIPSCSCVIFSFVKKTHFFENLFIYTDVYILSGWCQMITDKKTDYIIMP